MARYCIFRTDRIGDLILTLPMAEAIKRHDPSAQVSFCVQDYTRALADLNPFIDDIISIPARDLNGGVAAFARDLRVRAIDTALFAYPRPRLSLAARLAGIPARVGIAYRWYSPLYNVRRREHRNASLIHERDYNLNLLREIDIPIAANLVPLLRIPPKLEQQARTVLRSCGMHTENEFIVLHPGSGGSAKDWPAASFAALAQRLLERDTSLQILVSGTSAERPLTTPLAEAAGDRAFELPGDIPLDLFAAVLAHARLCIANSTGPLHIAAAAGTPVLGLYPFQRVCHPRRWGPLGRHSNVLLPLADEACIDCRAGTCAVHDDMRRLSVSSVFEAAIEMLGGE